VTAAENARPAASVVSSAGDPAVSAAVDPAISAGDPAVSAAGDPAIVALIAAGRRVGARRLTWGTAGNISVRLPDGRFAISGSGCRLDELTPQTIAICDAAGWDGGCRPSVETGLHRAIYAARPDVGAVLHASAFHTTLVACSDVELETAASTDTLYYLRRIARVPFLVPGSDELAAAAARAAAAGHDVLLLANHGSVVCAPDLPAAVNVTEALELMCRMLVARSHGFPLLPIPEELRADALRRMDE
jgi:ribulose-5-phosphate 4-epimerase/fuculose-1-phosphate aldolase